MPFATVHKHSLHIISISPLYQYVATQVKEVYCSTAMRHGCLVLPPTALRGPEGLQVCCWAQLGFCFKWKLSGTPAQAIGQGDRCSPAQYYVTRPFKHDQRLQQQAVHQCSRNLDWSWHRKARKVISAQF